MKREWSLKGRERKKWQKESYGKDRGATRREIKKITKWKEEKIGVKGKGGKRNRKKSERKAKR